MTPTEPSTYPTAGELLQETVPLLDAIPVYGPPVVAVVGPWLLFALMLAGPFALLVTLVALLVAPYVLVRHLHRERAGHASLSAPAVQIVAGESRWGAA